MKNISRPRPFAFRARRILSTLIQPAVLGLLLTHAQAGNTWTGGGASNNWSDNNNWGGSAPGYGTLTFTTGGGQGTTSFNNSISAQNQLLWTGSSAWTLNGSTTLSLFDNGGTQAKIENQSTGLVTINDAITFAATSGTAFGEINAVNGDLTFGTGTLTVNGSAVNGIKMFGANHTTTFNNTVSASGKWFGLTAANTTVAVGGAFTSGDIYVMNGGTLKLNSGGSITSTAIRLGGDFGTTGNQNQTLGGTLQLTAAAGGQSFGSIINTISGNTSGALLVDSQNTSGTNTISGAIFLDSNLRMNQASGGTTSLTNASLDLKAQTLTLTGSGGTYNVTGVIGNSVGSGQLVLGVDGTAGGPTVNLSNANTYSGQTFVRAGTLAFTSAGSAANSTIRLGSTSGSSVDASINLTTAGGGTTISSVVNPVATSGSGTLSLNSQNTSGTNTYSGHVGLDRNFTITQSAGGTLGVTSVHTGADVTNSLGTDIKGFTLTLTPAATGTVNVSGTIYNSTGSGAVTLNGAGTAILGGTNTYTGATTISAGRLAVNGSTAAGSAVTVQSGGTLGGSGTVGGTVLVQSGGHFAPGNSISTTFATGALTLASGSFSDIELGTAGASHASPGTSDRTAVSGALALGGTLNLINNAGADGNGTVGAGSYRIFTQTGSATGAFSAVVDPTAALHAKVDAGTSGSVFVDVYRLATVNTIGTPVSLGNIHTGGTFTSSGLSIQNTASGDGFSEGLTASGGALTGDATTSGSVTNLAGGSTSTGVSVSLTNTGTAGAKSGTVSVNLASDGTNSAHSNTALASQTISVSGGVYNLASANTIGTPVNLGTVHQGGTFGTSALSISNTAAAGAFTEGLNASFSGITGAASNNGGSFSNLAGGANNSTLIVGLGGNANTGAAGTVSGTTTVALVSNGTASGLANTALTSQTISVSGFVYSGQGVWNVNSNGSWSSTGNWQTNGGVPGLDAGFTNTDTATFGAAATSTNPTVSLNGVSPSLKGVTFNNPTQSYTVAQGSGGTLKLNNGASAATISNLNGTHTISAPVELQSNLAVSGGSGSKLTISGVLSETGGAKTLSVNTAGTLTLAAANTFTGDTTVTAGTLNVTNTTGSATGSGAVTVSASGQLAGTGHVVAAVNKLVTLSGILSAGDATLGAPIGSSLELATSGTGSTLFSTGSLVKLDLITGAGLGNNSSLSTAADRLKISGDLTIASGAMLQIDNPYSMSGWAAGDRWRVFDWSSVGSITGSFASIDIALPTLGAGLAWDTSDLLTTSGAFSGTIDIQAVPEPGSVLVGIFCGLSVALRRRRRQA